MSPELAMLFTETMQPKSRAAAKLGTAFAHWVVAELRDRGAHTIGFGPVPAAWRLANLPLGKALLQRELTQGQLFRLLARVFFYGKERTIADAHLCLITAQLAFAYGLMGAQQT